MSGISKDKEAWANKDEVVVETGAESESVSVAADDDMLMQKTPAQLSVQILRRTGYVVSYNPETRIPNWVAWKLTADHVTGPYKRKGVEFHADDEAEGPRVDTYDYARSGYDRGHMCPSGDNKWSREAQEESFLMTNMCPQNHQLNTGDWNELEIRCRRWAQEYGSVYVVAGPILFDRKHKTIGRNKVTVPEAFFKVVLCMEGRPKAVGFIYRNESGNRPQGDYLNSVDQIERITGFDFFSALPDAIENKVEKEADLNEWKY
uniref:Endonuclease n=1 Tax=Prevotella sp. GTC17254 TaxID=3236794 RepID=A0AB33IVL2_9BACT